VVAAAIRGGVHQLQQKKASLSLGERSGVSIWLTFALVLGATYLLLICWMAFEFATAPLLDEELRVISDPHGRISPRRIPTGHGGHSPAPRNPAETV